MTNYRHWITLFEIVFSYAQWNREGKIENWSNYEIPPENCITYIKAILKQWAYKTFITIRGTKDMSGRYNKLMMKGNDLKTINKKEVQDFKIILVFLIFSLKPLFIDHKSDKDESKNHNVLDMSENLRV